MFRTLVLVGVLIASNANAALPPGEVTILCSMVEGKKLNDFAFHLPDGFSNSVVAQVEVVDPLRLLAGVSLTDILVDYDAKGNAVLSLNSPNGSKPRNLLVMTQIDGSSQFGAVLGDMSHRGKERTGRCFGIVDAQGTQFKTWQKNPTTIGR